MCYLPKTKKFLQFPKVLCKVNSGNIIIIIDLRKLRTVLWLAKGLARSRMIISSTRTNWNNLIIEKLHVPWRHHQGYVLAYF